MRKGRSKITGGKGKIRQTTKIRRNRKNRRKKNKKKTRNR